jgi:hypothetical protein
MDRGPQSLSTSSLSIFSATSRKAARIINKNGLVGSVTSACASALVGVIFFTGAGSWGFEFPTAFLAAKPPPTRFSFNDQWDASGKQPVCI